MKNLSPEQKVMAELNGHVQAMRVCISALISSMPPEQQPVFAANLRVLGEHHSAVLLAQAVPEELIQSFAAALQPIQQQYEQLNS